MPVLMRRTTFIGTISDSFPLHVCDYFALFSMGN
jgi:hypothetical protein